MINIKVGDIVRHKYENRYSPNEGIAELYGIVRGVSEGGGLVDVYWFHYQTVTDHHPASLEVIIAS
jgi:hypothetical protein